jgi:hypothetical protein
MFGWDILYTLRLCDDSYSRPPIGQDGSRQQGGNVIGHVRGAYVPTYALEVIDPEAVAWHGCLSHANHSRLLEEHAPRAVCRRAVSP